MSRFSILAILLTLLACQSQAANGDVNDSLQSAQRLTDLIDRLIEQDWDEADVTPATVSSDREFVRRVYLDIAGRVPRVDEVATFLADNGEDKRHRLVLLLTDSEDHVQHFADTFDTLLMGRGSDGDYGERSKHGWRGFLENAFRKNRPWNEVAHDIVLARPSGEDDRGSAWFLYERQNKHQAIAEAVAPVVFGIRVECAQCHDHPSADEILQAHYWGLVAFFNRGTNAKTKNGPRVGESAIGGFSEFADLTGDSQPNFLTFLQAETIEESRPEKDVKQEDLADDYEPAPAEGDPRVPRFSRRQKFADEVVASHPLVARAMVNRIWAMMMGRGIVHPFDQMDSVHAASHPELLDALTTEFKDLGFDVRLLVRAIAFSRPYQLSSVAPPQIDDPSHFAWYLERPLTAEQLARSIQLVVRNTFRNNDPLVGQVRGRLVDVMPEESVTTIKDALFLTNNRALNRFIGESQQPEHLVPRISQIESQQQAIDEIFEAAFTRQPAADEKSRIADYVADGDKSEKWRQVVWALLTSAEFRFNH